MFLLETMAISLFLIGLVRPGHQVPPRTPDVATAEGLASLLVAVFHIELASDTVDLSSPRSSSPVFVEKQPSSGDPTAEAIVETKKYEK